MAALAVILLLRVVRVPLTFSTALSDFGHNHHVRSASLT